MDTTAIERIRLNWERIDAWLASGETDVVGREINDCSYFALLFSQLAGAIETATGWLEARRDPADDYTFRDRVKDLVADISIEEDEAEAILEQYVERCDIAHGRKFRRPGPFDSGGGRVLRRHHAAA